jgi:hypothetical protein
MYFSGKKISDSRLLNGRFKIRGSCRNSCTVGAAGVLREECGGHHYIPLMKP